MSPEHRLRVHAASGNESSLVFFYLDFSCHKPYYLVQTMNRNFTIEPRLHSFKFCPGVGFSVIKQ
ncbi:MAG: hypothetical protein C4522_22420 [Desulfobacteraceae bacterium]|nr:MAG: hypothetical protein C4522_22420 [Desulfobacteraceae bacterium]